MLTTIPPARLREFARITVQTGDLDPMYDLIWRGRQEYGEQWANQYSFMFFMFYDAGQAAAMAKAHTELDFWHMINYGYAGFKRGTERRHFRGDKGKDAVLKFQRMGSPRFIWDKMWGRNYTVLSDRIKNEFGGCQVGPYFTWKAMDLMDRCLSRPIELSLKEAMLGMPEEPRKCATTIWPDSRLSDILDEVVNYIHDLDAPGKPGKRCGYAEAETILCMMKGYFITKTHTIGDDVDEKHKQLIDAGHAYLCKLLPEKQDWSKYVRAMDAA